MPDGKLYNVTALANDIHLTRERWVHIIDSNLDLILT